MTWFVRGALLALVGASLWLCLQLVNARQDLETYRRLAQERPLTVRGQDLEKILPAPELSNPPLGRERRHYWFITRRGGRILFVDGSSGKSYEPFEFDKRNLDK